MSYCLFWLAVHILKRKMVDDEKTLLIDFAAGYSCSLWL